MSVGLTEEMVGAVVSVLVVVVLSVVLSDIELLQLLPIVTAVLAVDLNASNCVRTKCVTDITFPELLPLKPIFYCKGCVI